jgi:hypothetical protein
MSNDFYTSLFKELKAASENKPSTSIDNFFKSSSTTSVRQLKQITATELLGFIKVGNDLLIHKSDKDLWKLKKDRQGNYFIECLVSSSEN